MNLKYPITRIKNANNTDLVNILANPDFTEDKYIEFKAEFYTGNQSAEELRKDFSAFANSGGGLIFFGIDNRKNICGIDYSEIRGGISQKLSQLYINWDIINSILLPSGKCVYITQIEEISLYWKKPIITDGSVWYRDNGICVKVNNIYEYFKYDKFLPYDIKYFEYLCNEDRDILERLEYGYQSIPFYYIRIFAEFEIFLKNSIEKFVSNEDSQKARAILGKFQEFEKAIKTKQQNSFSSEENQQVSSIINNSFNLALHEIIGDFKNLYNYE